MYLADTELANSHTSGGNCTASYMRLALRLFDNILGTNEQLQLGIA